MPIQNVKTTLWGGETLNYNFDYRHYTPQINSINYKFLKNIFGHYWSDNADTFNEITSKHRLGGYFLYWYRHYLTTDLLIP